MEAEGAKMRSESLVQYQRAQYEVDVTVIWSQETSPLKAGGDSMEKEPIS